MDMTVMLSVLITSFLNLGLAFMLIKDDLAGPASAFFSSTLFQVLLYSNSIAESSVSYGPLQCNGTTYTLHGTYTAAYFGNLAVLWYTARQPPMARHHPLLMI